jgi:hypothetical protein
MDNIVDVFIARQNVRHFKAMLLTDPSITRQKMLRKLLAAEEAKLAALEGSEKRAAARHTLGAMSSSPSSDVGRRWTPSSFRSDSSTSSAV